LVSDAHAAGPDHHWNLDVPPEPLWVSGHDARLHQVVANLLANARVHTPADTTVTLSLTSDGDPAILRVMDDGPGKRSTAPLRFAVRRATPNSPCVCR
jgi:two-component system OmpR family sensor kinase